MNGERVWAYDIEFETIDRGFSASRLTSMLESANELGAQRLSVCGEDPDRSRFISTFAELCDLAATFGMGVDLECMAWRQVSSFPEAALLVKEAGRPNCGALIDALHLSRTGSSPADIRDVPPNLIRSAQSYGSAPAATLDAGQMRAFQHQGVDRDKRRTSRHGERSNLGAKQEGIEDARRKRKRDDVVADRPP
jgi:hypothetical protein